MSSGEGQPKEFLLSNTLAHELSHSLRTPLSVVMNDLSFFATILGEQELARATARCREIVGALDTITRFGAEPLRTEMVLAVDLAPDISNAVGQCILVDRRRLEFTIEILAATFEGVPTIELENDALALVFSVKTLARSESFLETMAETSQRRLTLAPLIEAFVLSSNGSITCESGPPAKLILRFPVCT